jgi:hypothetical protein
MKRMLGGAQLTPLLENDSPNRELGHGLKEG